MSHVRHQIRDAVVAALTGLVTTGERVYAGRTRPLTAAQYPCLLVYAVEEASEVEAMGRPAILARTLTLAVEGRCASVGGELPDETLDRMAVEVETVIGDPIACAAVLVLAKEITLTATRIATQAPGESQVGEINMEFRVLYHTQERAPETAI